MQSYDVGRFGEAIMEPRGAGTLVPRGAARRPALHVALQLDTYQNQAFPRLCRCVGGSLHFQCLSPLDPYGLRADTMRLQVAVLASALLFGSATELFAQNFNDYMNRFSDMARARRAKLVESEWRKLPPTELACINAKLQERGDSIESLARRAILPSDSRVADILSQCGPARSTETAPVAAPPQLGNVPESVVSELRQTVETLKANLAESAAKLAELEKEKAEADRGLKQAESDRTDAENARHEIEQMGAAQKTAFALITQLETDKASLDAEAHKWKLTAIAGIVAFAACLLAWTFTRLTMFRGRKP